MKKFLLIALALCLWNAALAQKFAVSTNFLDYANFATMNLEASYGIDRHWSLDAGVKLNPFTFNPGESSAQNRQRSFSTGARYWPWHIYSGWWLSGAVRYQEYNNGGFRTRRTSEGDRFGGGVGGGYTYMISPHFNLDLGAGAWAGYDVYKVYACQNCGKIISEGQKFFILPSDIMLSLTYIF